MLRYGGGRGLLLQVSQSDRSPACHRLDATSRVYAMTVSLCLRSKWLLEAY